MPLGGASIGWNNNAPLNSDSAGFGDDEIRSTRSNVQGAIDAEHHFPVAGGPNTGLHRQGSARPYLAPTSSAVSSDGTDARLVINAVDGTLWQSRSATSMELVGHPLSLFMGSASTVTAPPQFGMLVQTGQVLTGASGNTRAAFPSAYSGIPIVFVTSNDPSTFPVSIAASGTTGFTAYMKDFAGGAVVNGIVNWLSVGSVSMGVS